MIEVSRSVMWCDVKMSDKAEIENLFIKENLILMVIFWRMKSVSRKRTVYFWTLEHDWSYDVNVMLPIKSKWKENLSKQSFDLRHCRDKIDILSEWTDRSRAYAIHSNTTVTNEYTLATCWNQLSILIRETNKKKKRYSLVFIRWHFSVHEHCFSSITVAVSSIVADSIGDGIKFVSIDRMAVFSLFHKERHCRSHCVICVLWIVCICNNDQLAKYSW